MTSPIPTSKSYAVQWQTVHRPERWTYYSRYYPNIGDAIRSYTAALQAPGCIDARIIEREQIYHDVTRRTT